MDKARFFKLVGIMLVGRHGRRCKPLAGVFAKQILLWAIVAGTLLLPLGCTPKKSAEQIATEARIAELEAALLELAKDDAADEAVPETTRRERRERRAALQEELATLGNPTATPTATPSAQPQTQAAIPESVDARLDLVEAMLKSHAGKIPTQDEMLAMSKILNDLYWPVNHEDGTNQQKTRLAVLEKEYDTLTAPIFAAQQQAAATPQTQTPSTTTVSTTPTSYFDEKDKFGVWYDERQRVPFYYTIVDGRTVRINGFRWRQHPDWDMPPPETLSLSIPQTIQGLPVTVIRQGAFIFDKNITSVTIPSSVTAIGEQAFSDRGYTGRTGTDTTDAGKAKLTSVTFASPSSLTTIGEQAFYWCVKLTSITIPSSVTTIGQQAFAVSGLTSVTFASPSSLRTLGVNAFGGCRSLTSITLPSTITTIEASTFALCESLRSITIPSSVRTIGGSAFQGSGLTSITIPASVTSLGRDVFALCNNLISVTFEGTIAANNYGRTGVITDSTDTVFNNLWEKYLNGGPGTYTRPNSSSTEWTKR